MKIQNIFQATFLKCKGFEIGKVQWNKEIEMVDIEVKGETKDIEAGIREYESGGQINCKQFANELGYIKFLVKKNVPR